MSKEYVRKDWHKSSDPKHRLGVEGEDRTAKYITESLGMTVLGRNVRFCMGEIDIVARDKNRLCFIEVKTRSNFSHGRPSLGLTAEKQRTIRMLAQTYMKYHKEYKHLIPRIDVAEVLKLDDGWYINYIKSAF